MLIRAALLLLVSCTLSSCGSGKKYSTTFTNPAFGYEISDFDLWNEEYDKNAKGALAEDDVVSVTLNGKTHKVQIEEDYYSDEEDDIDFVVVTDLETDDARVITFDPGLHELWLATVDGPDHDVTITKNPDASYTVNDVTVPNGKAAVAELRKNPAYQAASPWAIMAAFALSAGPPESRGKYPCNTDDTRFPGDQSNRSLDGTAGGGASSELARGVFPDLLVCVACDKSGKTSCPGCE